YDDLLADDWSEAGSSVTGKRNRRPWICFEAGCGFGTDTANCFKPHTLTKHSRTCLVTSHRDVCPEVCPRARMADLKWLAEVFKLDGVVPADLQVTIAAAADYDEAQADEFYYMILSRNQLKSAPKPRKPAATKCVSVKPLKSREFVSDVESAGEEPADLGTEGLGCQGVPNDKPINELDETQRAVASILPAQADIEPEDELDYEEGPAKDLEEEIPLIGSRRITDSDDES